MSSDLTAIRVSNLGKCYHIYDRPQDRLKQTLWRGRKQFFREFWALRDVSFEVRKGETIGIIGRNGSGKSTLLQLIVGTLTPSLGEVSVTGRIAALLELGSGFNPDFTGRENVYMNGAILGLSEEEIDRRFDEIAAFASIGDFIDQPVKTYSSGMMVRLAFAVSVCVEPDILIIDEALAVGDMAFQFKCMERLDQLAKSGTTLLFVSHDVNAVRAFCQRAIYLINGVIHAVGSASDMAELYLLDMRDEQKRASTGSSQVSLKPALGGENAIAFGTNQGRIARACFSGSNANQDLFSTGERISLEIELEFDRSVKNPAINIAVTDHRLIEVGGTNFPIETYIDQGGYFRARLKAAFVADFNNGRYFITLRLEDRTSEMHFFPIDKQVAALSFQIMRPPTRYFSGLIDLRIHLEP